MSVERDGEILMEDNNLGEADSSLPSVTAVSGVKKKSMEICEINNSVCEGVKKTCARRFKSASLDAAVTRPVELVQLKVVIALLISPINFSECTEEREHNRENVLTIHFLASLPHLLLAVCTLSLCFNSSPLPTPKPLPLTSDFSPSFENIIFCPFLLFYYA